MVVVSSGLREDADRKDSARDESDDVGSGLPFWVNRESAMFAIVIESGLLQA